MFFEIEYFSERLLPTVIIYRSEYAHACHYTLGFPFNSKTSSAASAVHSMLYYSFRRRIRSDKPINNYVNQTEELTPGALKKITKPTKILIDPLNRSKLIAIYVHMTARRAQTFAASSQT